MPNTELLYLSRADVEATGVDMTTVVRLVEDGFREKAAGRVEMPPKPGIHPGGDAFIHAMPALIPAMRSAGVKWVFSEDLRVADCTGGQTDVEAWDERTL